MSETMPVKGPVFIQQSATRRSNGGANKLALDDRPAHDWYRFVLSYPPHLVSDYLQKFHLTAEHRVLDPFCGTGTTLVECKKLGIPSYGIEAHPMSHFASQVKVDWHPDPDGLLQHATHIAHRTVDKLLADDIDESFPLVLFEKALDQERDFSYQTLPADLTKLLLTNSISPLPLHKSLTLLATIRENDDQRYTRHLLLAFAKALVFSISNLNFGPEVGVGRIKYDAQVVAPWLANVSTMADDLRELRAGRQIPSEVYCADSRQMTTILPSNSIDAVITSPPYPNEKDYTRTTRLESILLGFVTSRDELRQLKRGLVRSNTRGVYKGDDDDQWIAANPEIQRIAEAIEARRIELGKTSGFERLYGRVTKLYFGGMAKHLAALRQVLRPNAQLAYVVGDQASYLRIMIRTGQILADIAKSLGYDVVGIDLFRTRLATATKEQLREEVVVLRWPG